MKKIIGLLLIVAVIFGMCSCDPVNENNRLEEDIIEEGNGVTVYLPTLGTKSLTRENAINSTETYRIEVKGKKSTISKEVPVGTEKVTIRCDTGNVTIWVYAFGKNAIKLEGDSEYTSTILGVGSAETTVVKGEFSKICIALKPFEINWEWDAEYYDTSSPNIGYLSYRLILPKFSNKNSFEPEIHGTIVNKYDSSEKYRLNNPGGSWANTHAVWGSTTTLGGFNNSTSSSGNTTLPREEYIVTNGYLTYSAFDRTFVLMNYDSYLPEYEFQVGAPLGNLETVVVWE